MSSRVADEWQGFVTRRPDWSHGLLQVVLLVDTPLPTFLDTVRRVDFRNHDRERYLRGLRELLAGLLGHEDLRRLPELPADLEVPEPPDPRLTDTLRRQLVDTLTPIVEHKPYRRAVATGLGLERRVRDGYSSSECTAAAALVLATGDDDPLAAARRVVDVVVEEFDDEPERVRELKPIGKEIEREIERRRDDGPERGLLATWLRRVERDHGTLVTYFQERAGFDLLEPVYVQLELQPEDRTPGELRGEQRFDRPMSLPEVLELDPRRHASVLPGARLPTEEEWEYACRAGTRITPDGRTASKSILVPSSRRILPRHPAATLWPVVAATGLLRSSRVQRIGTSGARCVIETC